MSEPVELIAGDALKNSAVRCAMVLKAKIEGEQRGFFSVFDKWFTQVLTDLMRLDPQKSWEQAVFEAHERNPKATKGLAWDLVRLRMFLDRWEQGRFVDYERREASGLLYVPREGREFGADVFLTSQGAPSIMQWRDVPLMKTVFDYALYPMILAELRPRTILEIGSGLGASALWLADHLAMLKIPGHVHSVDINPISLEHPGVTFHQGDCFAPADLFASVDLASAPHPWLVIEDAHQNVEGVLDHFHTVMRPGDYLIVEDSEVKRGELTQFAIKHLGIYQVDTKFTDYFGRNATCAADAIFARIAP
jgi:hypothetical protein